MDSFEIPQEGAQSSHPAGTAIPSGRPSPLFFQNPEHPSPEDLERFLRSETPRSQSARVLAHLLRCEECRKQIQPLMTLLFGKAALSPVSPYLKSCGIQR